MNNYEKIKQMSIEEMAEFLQAICTCREQICTKCIMHKMKTNRLCRLTSYYSSGAKQWLESEVANV